MILYFRDQDIRADALKEGIDIGRQESRTEGIFAMIALCLETGLSQDHIPQKLQQHFCLTPEVAQEYFEQYQEVQP